MVLEYIAFIVIVIGIASLKIINQYDRAVVFTLGRYSGILQPGLNFVIPFIQRMQRLDVRVNVISVPEQETMTKDNVSVSIDAVIYYKVSDAKSAVINVEDYSYATIQLAQTTLREVVGEATLDELLGQREKISKKIEGSVAQRAMQWGIEISAVELKDIKLPDDLVRVIGKQAEADREKRAVVIKASGELEAAKSLAKAAKELSSVPGGLHIRMLQTINNLGNEKSITEIFTTPSEVLDALLEFVKKK